MTKPDCCTQPNWQAVRDLGHAHSFEFILGQCANCGAYWLNVFCVATNRVGYEPVSAEDLPQMQSLPEGRPLKTFMKDWLDTNL